MTKRNAKPASQPEDKPERRTVYFPGRNIACHFPAEEGAIGRALAELAKMMREIEQQEATDESSAE